MTERFAQLPPDRHLTPAIVKLKAEARDLFARARAARDVVDQLADPGLDETAHKADLEARGVAVRAGKPASSVGQPATDELVEQRAAALVEFEALHTAAAQVEDLIRDEFAQLRADGHGLDAVKKTRSAYAKALDAVAPARVAYLEAVAVVRYVDHAAGEQYLALAHDLRVATRGVDIARLPDHNGERVHVLRPMNVDKVLQVFRADLEDDPTAKKEN